MNASEDLAPAVDAILSSARSRSSPANGPVSVEPRSFARAISRAEAAGQVPLIAEVKPTSPTTEGTRDDDPATLARAMERGGASAISVLTEPTHFGGSPEALRAVREAVSVPVLRKDFILEESHLDIVEADLVLLIARFLGDDLPDLLEAADARGFQVLVETHTEAEVHDAVDAGASIIGINNRDLARLEVDLSTFESVAPAVPDDVIVVAESGIDSPADARRMREAGADALLVGSSIMAGDVADRTARLVEAEQ